ncbi:MAG: hypothetical protein ACK5JH_17000 [Anaerocolumna sp.]
MKNKNNYSSNYSNKAKNTNPQSATDKVQNTHTTTESNTATDYTGLRNSAKNTKDCK